MTVRVPSGRPPFARGQPGGSGAPIIGAAVFQGLHPGHLVNAEHGAAWGRVEIEVADLGHFLPKVRVGAVQPAPYQMRPHGALREDPLHGRPADRRHDPAGGRLLSHLLEGPRDRDVPGLPTAVRPGVLLPDRLTRQRDDLAASDRAELQGMTTARQIAEPLEALAEESPSPAFDAPHGDSQAARDLTRASAFGARQNDPRPGGGALSTGRRSYSEGQCCGFLGRQLERQRRPTTSRRGTHLGDLPYRNVSEMYSVFSRRYERTGPLALPCHGPGWPVRVTDPQPPADPHLSEKALNGKRPRDELAVEPQARAVGVDSVHGELHRRRREPRGELRQACQSGPAGPPKVEFLTAPPETRHVVGCQRPWTHRAHLPAKDVDELGHLVEAGGAEEEPSHARVPAITHGSELQNLERPASISDALLTKEHGQAIIDQYCRRNERHCRREHQQSHHGPRYIEHPPPAPRPPAH